MATPTSITSSTPTSRAPSPFGLHVQSPPKQSSSIRVHVQLDPSGCTVVSYADLYRKEMQQRTLESLETGTTESGATPGREDGGNGSNEFLDQLEKRIQTKLAQEEENGKETAVTSSATSSKKRAANAEDDYDVDDPFIDDADLFLEDLVNAGNIRRPDKYRGFFVLRGSLGEVIAADNEEKSDKVKGGKRLAKRARITSKEGGSRKAKDDDTEEDDSDTEMSLGKKKIEGAEGKKAEESDREKERRGKTRKRLEEENSVKKKVTIKTKTNDGDVQDLDAKKRNRKDISDGDTMAKNAVKRQSSSAGELPAKKEKLENGSTLKTSGVMSKETSSSSNFETASPTKPRTKKNTNTNTNANINTELKPLDNRVQKLMNQLREAAAKESFENKSHFPDALRPLVVEAACIILGDSSTMEVDDNFLNHLMAILPYNRLTLRKFVIRNVLRVKIDEKNKILKASKERFHAKVQAAMVPLLAAEQSETSEFGSNHENEASAPSQRTLDDDNSDDKKEDEEKTKKFRWTEDLRQSLYDIIQLEMDICETNNTLSDIAQKPAQKPEIQKIGTARKNLYKELLAYWPDGWMSSVEIGRQYSDYKRKLEKKKDITRAVTNEPEPSTQQIAPKKFKRIKPSSADSETTSHRTELVSNTDVKRPRPKSKEGNGGTSLDIPSVAIKKAKSLPSQFTESQTEVSTPNSNFDVSSLLTPSPGGLSENSTEDDGGKNNYEPMHLDV